MLCALQMETQTKAVEIRRADMLIDLVMTQMAWPEVLVVTSAQSSAVTASLEEEVWLVQLRHLWGGL